MGVVKIRHFAQAISDPIFISIIGNVLETLTSSPSAGVYETVVKRALSPLSQALQNAKAEESWVASSALELLGGLVEGADSEKGLGAGFISAIGPPLFKCLINAEDRDVLQVRMSDLSRDLTNAVVVERCFCFDPDHQERLQPSPRMD
jgi:hypothetical protein